jgi:hypothetical protein
MVWAVVSLVGLVVETSVIVALGLSATGHEDEAADAEARERIVERAVTRSSGPAGVGHVRGAWGAPGAPDAGRARRGGS